MRWLAFAVMRRCIAACLLVLAACSGGDDEDAVPDDVPSCADLYAEGASTDAIVERNNLPLDEGGCTTDAGEWESQGLAFFDCSDGERTVHYNEFGWGISGGEWHHYAAGETAPTADVC